MVPLAEFHLKVESSELRVLGTSHRISGCGHGTGTRDFHGDIPNQAYAMRLFFMILQRPSNTLGQCHCDDATDFVIDCIKFSVAL